MTLQILAGEGGFQAFELGGAEWAWLWFSAFTAVLALGVGFYLMKGVLAADTGTDKMREIALAIQEGAMAYLRRQFRTIAMIVVPLTVLVFLTSTEVLRPDGSSALSFTESGLYPHPRLPRRLHHVGPHRLHRHEPRRPRQRPHRRRRQARLPARRPQGGLPHGRRGRHVHRRPRPPRRHHHHHDLPEHRLGHPDRLRLRRIAAGPVHAGRRRHLHQGGRRRCRPGGQGRGGHPRGRPPQRRHHRRQRGRQRRRLRRHGGRPVRVLRGHPGGVDHPGLRRLRVDRPQPRPRRDLPCRLPGHRRAGVDRGRVRGEGHRQGQVGDGAHQPGIHHRRRPHRDRHVPGGPVLRAQPEGLLGRRHRPGPGPGRQPAHRVLHVHRDRPRA